MLRPTRAIAALLLLAACEPAPVTPAKPVTPAEPSAAKIAEKAEKAEPQSAAEESRKIEEFESYVSVIYQCAATFDEIVKNDFADISRAYAGAAKTCTMSRKMLSIEANLPKEVGAACGDYLNTAQRFAQAGMVAADKQGRAEEISDFRKRSAENKAQFEVCFFVLRQQQYAATYGVAE